jgi:Putative transposase
MVKAGVETVKAVMSRAAGCETEIGVIAVVQTAGRASNYNPHVHMMVTGGGIDRNGRWQEVKAISYDYLHREWQKQLLEMIEQESRSDGLTGLLEKLRKE